MTAERSTLRTFNNQSGRNVFYRSLIHPMTAPRTAVLIEAMAAHPSIAVYDPSGYFADFAAMHDLSAWRIEGLYVQRIEEVGQTRAGLKTRPVTDLPSSTATALFVAEFDSARQLLRLGPYRPETAECDSFDRLRLEPEWLTVPARYLDPLNFVSDFLFFRDADGLHTSVSTANYWHGHGAKATRLWCCLFDGDGNEIAAWEQPLPASASAIVLNSRDARTRFDLGEFTGSLFVHVIGTAAHDTLKYAVDVFDDSGDIATATHDSNPWPAEFYAGLPAARPGETVRLWVQNCYPTPIPRGKVGLRVMGHGDFLPVDVEIAPYATLAVDPRRLFPDATWPAQFEIRADKYFCRPRYEITLATGRNSIAHANVERTDLKPAPDLAEATRLIGKGFILPAPLLPVADWTSTLLPTPMATAQQSLSLTVRAYDADGALVSERPLGRRDRGDQISVNLDDVVGGRKLAQGYGHIELGYDFANGAEADGWMHALFRYTRRDTAQSAETSFGSHMFNVAAVWRNEPNSYLGPPPGLSTRLFLRLTDRPGSVLCHLIYPTSGQWRAFSETDLILHDAMGAEIVRKRISIPCSGSRLIDTSTLFSGAELAAARGGYVIIRDTTCRLFGYHMFLSERGGFALDHMFGF